MKSILLSILTLLPLTSFSMEMKNTANFSELSGLCNVNIIYDYEGMSKHQDTILVVKASLECLNSTEKFEIAENRINMSKRIREKKKASSELDEGKILMNFVMNNLDNEGFSITSCTGNKYPNYQFTRCSFIKH